MDILQTFVRGFYKSHIDAKAKAVFDHSVGYDITGSHKWPVHSNNVCANDSCVFMLSVSRRDKFHMCIVNCSYNSQETKHIKAAFGLIQCILYAWKLHVMVHSLENAQLICETAAASVCWNDPEARKCRDAWSFELAWLLLVTGSKSACSQPTSSKLSQWTDNMFVIFLLHHSKY